MMSINEREIQLLPSNLCFHELVPKDNFYRCLDERLDLSFVREQVVDSYAAMRRVIIDPVVFFRPQLVMFIEDIRSEPWLIKVAADRLSIR
jgi:hypothetical protein